MPLDKMEQTTWTSTAKLWMGTYLTGTNTIQSKNHFFCLKIIEYINTIPIIFPDNFKRCCSHDYLISWWYNIQMLLSVFCFTFLLILFARTSSTRIFGRSNHGLIKLARNFRKLNLRFENYIVVYMDQRRMPPRRCRTSLWYCGVRCGS